MTQMIYKGSVQFQTNGDCSEFEIVFPDSEDDNFIEMYRQKLASQGFPVSYPSIPNPKAIVFSARIIRKVKL